MNDQWPSALWIVRHGESAGNVARDKAHRGNLDRIDIAERDMDVPLSPLGEEQSRALGRWFGCLLPDDRPQVILTSPYRRAVRTAELIKGAALLSAPRPIVDERFREREFGILDRLTRRGIEELYPQQAEARRLVGKFYHRPPGGESWCDVVLRLRSLLHTLSLHQAGQRVLVITHQVVVLCFRYLLENLSEAEILAIDARADVANCAVTEYRLDSAAGGLKLLRYNFVAPLEAAGASVTSAPDANVAAR